MISIEIIADELFEEKVESFSVSMSTDVEQLLLDPKTTNVTITDTDSEFNAFL